MKSVIVFCLTLGSSLMLLQSAMATTFRWVDEDGTVHYSDKLPPSAMQRERKVLDDTGRTLKSVDRTRTKKEIEAEEDENAEQIGAQKQEAEAREERARKDHILLQTFSTERDLLIAREDRVTQVDSTIAILESNTAHSQERIDELEARIAQIEKGKRKPPESVLEELAAARHKLEKDQGFLARKREERQALVDRFEADITRFRELMSEREKAKGGS